MKKCVIAFAVAVCGGVVAAGPLNPPAGPVASTGKTLQQVEPRTAIDTLAGTALAVRKITQPGSYYLTGNLALAEGKTVGIEVEADGVTIDLNGFTLDGVNAVGSVGIKVADGFSCDGMRVINGQITDWETGIAGLGLYSAVVDSVRFTFCDFYGIDAGTGAVVTRSSAAACGIGFYLREGGTVTGCTASFCGRGFDSGSGAVLADCQAAVCGEGFYVAFGGSARSCAAYLCTTGFIGLERNTLVDCSATYGGDGFNFGVMNRLSGCQVSGGSGAGIIVGTGSTVERCGVQGQGLTGIIASSECTLSENRVQACGNVGISLSGSRNMVTGNSVIRCSLDNGVLVEGDNNQLEMNRVEGSGLVGIKVTGLRNLVVRNRVCASSRVGLGYLDYDAVAGNFIGTVLLGSSFVTTTEGNANFSCGFVPPEAPAAGRAGVGAGGGAGAGVPERNGHPERGFGVVPAGVSGRGAAK